MMSMMQTNRSHCGPMNPPTAQPASFESWQALVAPGDVFRHPREVLAHPPLSGAEKRAILASWASDACAVENAPDLRCPPGCRAEPVSVDVVLAALTRLDRAGAGGTGSAQSPPPAPRRPRRLSLLNRSVRRKRPDDDDPPPCPVASMPRPRTPPDATLALALPA